MEFTFIVLSALVAVTEQQFRQHPGEGMFWLAPYYSRQSATINDYLSSNYNNDELEMPCFRQLQRTDPGSKEADPKLRNKELIRYQPLPPNNARFVVNFSSRTHLLNKVNTITFTITSSVTFTKVQSCIPSNQFFPNFASVICRRKRAEIVESITNWKDIQLAIKPTYVQPVEPTVILALNLLTENAELPLISSSKDEDLLNEKQSSQEMPLSKQSRMKRLFFHLVTTTTVVSYTFFSATSTKTVNLLSVVGQGPGYLICRPEGFSVCSSTSTINT
ncbi:uncharacterized protein LOC116920973 [Daphnia magna]|uniref:Uncharacterized protein n=1 Tax=Daphnia magna TaxID=35525 RepID=A0ABQ9ZBR8_9CRUS|nr:uncharacterized protein LOC116920973 [Daphnia magna]KAK4010349.1 hypothetical protein OUZ56_019495 [Daphnia magna]